jgi:hypothetical protein
MFLIRYGSRVSVSDVHVAREARLRSHQVPIIISINQQGDPQEFPVDKEATTYATPPPPIEFEAPIRLESYELASNRIQRGGMIALILHWRSTKKIDKDYTVFAHLVNASGQSIEGYDSQPRGGKAPTSAWVPNELVPDGILISIPSDAPTGANNYLEIGLYYLPTMQRLSIIDATGHLIADRIVIGPIEVSE